MAVCTNGHPTEDEDSFCGRCAAPVDADLPITEPEWAKSELVPREQSAPTRTAHPLVGLALAALAVVALVVGINLFAGGSPSNTSDEGGLGDGTTDQEEILGRTPYGCEVVALPDGFEGSMVRIPYCTEVHAIERYCGRDAGTVLVPPVVTDAGRATLRDFVGYPSAMGDAYDRFVYTPGDAAVPGAAVVQLTCQSGTVKTWTNEEWSLVTAPS
jgi:hypothetical protein